MSKDQRKNVRFNDFGRAECAEICPVAGVLDDISLTGCKIHYDTPISMDMENDYEIHLRLSRLPAGSLLMLCHPQWQRQDEDGSTEVGFVFLHSPDTPALETYIKQREDEKLSENIDSVLPEEESCQFV